MPPTSVFPAGLDYIRTDVTDGLDQETVHADLHNLLADAVNKLELRARGAFSINPLDDGALGDGATPDDAAIASALARSAASGFRVRFQGGRTYRHAAPITPPSGATIEFEQGAVLKPTSALVGSSFEGTGVSGIKVLGLAWDGSAVPARAAGATYADHEGHCCYFLSSDHITFKDFSITRPMRGGLTFENSNDLTIRDGEISFIANGQVQDTYDASGAPGGVVNNPLRTTGLLAFGCKRGHVENVYVHDSGVSGGSRGGFRWSQGFNFHVRPSTSVDAWDWSVIDCRAERLGVQVHLDDNTGSGGGAFKCANYLGDPAHRSARVQFVNCSARLSGDGNFWFGGALDCQVTNLLSDTTWNGYGVELQGSQKIVFTNFIVKGMFSDGIRVQVGNYASDPELDVWVQEHVHFEDGIVYGATGGSNAFAGHGVMVQGGSGATAAYTTGNVTFVNVRSIGNPRSGFVAWDTTARVRFIGCTALDNGQFFSGYGFLVTGNSGSGIPSTTDLVNCVGTDSRAAGSKTQQNGVAVSNDATNTVIEGGYFLDNKFGAFNWTGLLTDGVTPRNVVVGPSVNGARSRWRWEAQQGSSAGLMALEDGAWVGTGTHQPQALAVYGFIKAGERANGSETDYSRLLLDASATDVLVAWQEAGTGWAAKALHLLAQNALQFGAGATKRAELDAAGSYFAPVAGQTLDLGNTTTRWRDLLLSREVRLAPATPATPTSGRAVYVDATTGLLVVRDTGGRDQLNVAAGPGPLVVVEHFVMGTTGSGSVGEWGWTHGQAVASGGSLSKGFVLGHPGIAILDTGATANSVYYALSSNGGGWLSDEDWTLDLLAYAPTIDANTLLRLGTATAASVSPPATGAWIEKPLGAGTTWQAITSLATVQTVTDTGVAWTQAAWHTFRVRKLGTTYSFSIDGSAETALTTNQPTGNSLAVFVQVGQNTAASRTLRVDRAILSFPNLTN